MSTDAAPRTDRRHLRRAETVEQILEVAVEVMGEQGVAGLSLGEVARRIGVRTPSLYGYFDSKAALYDAVFSRGWREVGEAMDRVGDPEDADDLHAYALLMAETYLRWTLAHPVHAHLMAWRPVPGWTPSPAAYEPAVDVLARSREVMRRLQELGLFDRDADVDEVLRAWTAMTSGVMTQQLANAPDEPFESGAFTSLLPQLVAMLLAHYAPKP